MYVISCTQQMRNNKIINSNNIENQFILIYYHWVSQLIGMQITSTYFKYTINVYGNSIKSNRWLVRKERLTQLFVYKIINNYKAVWHYTLHYLIFNFKATINYHAVN